MLGTLTLAAGSAAAGWLLQHAYQHMRYSFYEREDAAMLAPGADPASAAAGWPPSAPQSASGRRPSTIDALAASGDIDADLLADGESGPTRAATTPIARRRGLLDSRISRRRLAGAACRRRLPSLPWRRSPSPRAISASASCRSPSRGARRLVYRGLLPPPRRARRSPPPAWRSPGRSAPPCGAGGEWGDGDSLMLGCVLGSGRDAADRHPRAGARRRIPALHRVLAPDRSQDRRHAARTRHLARPHRGPRGGGAVMSAARAGGHRGQGTVEFVLILPLLIIMLVAVADYAHLARETGERQTASSEGRALRRGEPHPCRTTRSPPTYARRAPWATARPSPSHRRRRRRSR